MKVDFENTLKDIQYLKFSYEYDFSQTSFLPIARTISEAMDYPI